MAFKPRKIRLLMIILLTLMVLLAGPAFMLASGSVKYGSSWRNAPRTFSGEALDPAQIRDAVVQVYSARAVSWRGAFAVHTWVAVKPKSAPDYTTYEVTRWSGLRSRQGRPDASWFGNPAKLLVTLRGAEAEQAITRIESLLASYPYRRGEQYRAWPGPNSNTFVAWIVRHTPALAVGLPSTALGKDYLGGKLLAAAPSDTGYQFSAWGVLGLTFARQEGVEINLLGLVLGVTPSPGISWPGIGEISFND